MDTESSFLEGNGIIILILFFLFMSGGIGGFGNAAANGATQQDIFNASTNNGINTKLDGINQGITNAQYATMQGFANVTQSLNSGFDSVNAGLANLGFQMAQNCCDIKTQILQDKYESVSRELNTAIASAANSVQTNTILNALGKWTPYAAITTTTSA